MAQAWDILSNGEVMKDLSSKLNLCEYEVFPNRKDYLKKITLLKKTTSRLAWSVDKNPPANVGSNPGPGRSHILWRKPEGLLC